MDAVHRHLALVESYQADLEARIRDAIQALTPDELLTSDTLPEDIQAEFESFLSEALLRKFAAEAVRFVDYSDDETDIQVSKDKAQRMIAILADDYLVKIYAIADMIITNIQSAAKMQQELGRSETQVVAELENRTAGLGKQVLSLENRLVSITDTFVSSASGVMAITSTSGPLTWVVVQDGKECKDCAPRHGKSQSLADWTEDGLPRTGWSVCDGNCRCVLVPTEAYDGSGPVQRSRR